MRRPTEQLQLLILFAITIFHSMVCCSFPFIRMIRFRLFCFQVFGICFFQNRMVLFVPAPRPHPHRDRMLPRPAHISGLPGTGEADARLPRSAPEVRHWLLKSEFPGIRPLWRVFHAYRVVSGAQPDSHKGIRTFRLLLSSVYRNLPARVKRDGGKEPTLLITGNASL